MKFLEKQSNVSRSKSGFTLIELLVVISIIAILSSAVLAAINSSRKKAQDTHVISDVRQAQNQLEIDTVNGVYTDLGVNALAGGAHANFALLSNDATKNGSANGLSYITSANSSGKIVAYAIYGQLVSNPGTYYCRDSVGGSALATTSNSSIVCNPSSGGSGGGGGGGSVTISLTVNGTSYPSGSSIYFGQGTNSITLGWISNGTSCTISDNNGTGNYPWNSSYSSSGSVSIAIAPFSGDLPDTFIVSCSSGSSNSSGQITIPPLQ